MEGLNKGEEEHDRSVEVRKKGEDIKVGENARGVKQRDET